MDWHPELQDLGLVALAGGLGSLIGLEREISDKPAGLRTHIFVASAAALLMLLGNAILEEFNEAGRQIISADPIRVVQAIVIGISFLGAGTIIHQGGNRVEGLTTAASIFLTAGIGISVAVNQFIIAIGTTLFALTVLGLVGWVEKLIGNQKPEGSRIRKKATSSKSQSPQHSAVA